MNFRDTSSVKDITSLIKNTAPDNSVIWQTINGNRVVYSVDEILFNETLKTLKIIIKDFEHNLLVDETIYIKLSYRETLFKARVINLSGNVLSLYLPTEVKTHELRASERFKFKPKDGKFLTFNISNKSTTIVQKMKVKVVDISEQGLCVLLSNENRNFIKNASKVELSYLGHIELMFPLRADIKYTQHLKYRDAGKVVYANRAGLMLESKISFGDLLFYTSKATS